MTTPAHKIEFETRLAQQEAATARLTEGLENLGHNVDRLVRVVETVRTDQQGQSQLIASALASQGSIKGSALVAIIAVIVAMAAVTLNIRASDMRLVDQKLEGARAIIDAAQVTRDRLLNDDAIMLARHDERFDRVATDAAASVEARRELDAKLQLEIGRVESRLEDFRQEVASGARAGSDRNAADIADLRERTAAMDQLLSFLRTKADRIEAAQGELTRLLFDKETG